MTGPIAFRARRVITPSGERPAVVVVRDGVITDVTTDAPEHAVDIAQTIDVADDCVLLPGLVDSHVHVNEPGRTEWEGFATATAAAAAGGVTTIVDMPLNSIPPTIDVGALEVKRAAALGQLAIDVAFWGGAVPGNADQLRPLHEAGVVGFKCFLLPSGVEEFPPLDHEELLVAMSAIAAFDGLLIAHAEDGHRIGEARGRKFRDFAASRPPDAESAAVRRLIDAARRTGCRTHVVHLSAAESLPVIAAAKAEGLAVTAETCPHYLFFAADEIPDGATQFKSCPPIRDEANREALWNGVLDDTIDIVVSDHSPCTAQMKRLDTGDFGQAWGGIASVQLGLPAMWTQAARRGVPLSWVVDKMAARTAAFAGLADRGAIAPGMQADLVVFADDDQFLVDRSELRHRNPISPYHGHRLRGVVRETYLRGESVRDGARVGRLVTRLDA